MFDAIDTSGTGLSVYRTWIDAIANNIANVNDETPMSGPAFQAQYVQATPVGNGIDGVGHGVQATGLPGSSATGIPTYDPASPVADANGYVRRPDIDMSQQMGNLIMAQRAFQANANVVDRAKDVYEAAIAIGKGI
ncbi:MAG: flagellar basal-body rod protein FlgC [Pseudonocardiales bacterium]|jgi:flagellar basal-body rod protein FlgC|nr:flagellar basal-body rod protein FlgC [Pseudonocardiales bacterium]MDT4943596.1 flagellar basal-body rod protein FlgC [Pseudonocardiales bacterium]